MKPGIYGKPVHTWEFSSGEDQEEIWWTHMRRNMSLWKSK
jgi:hypothetical protein